MIFSWNLSTAALLMLGSLNFLEYYYIQSIEGYPAESFSQVEILEKQLRFEFSKWCQKVVWLPLQHSWGLIGGAGLFWMENSQEERHEAETPNSKPFWKYARDFGEKGTILACIGLLFLSQHSRKGTLCCGCGFEISRLKNWSCFLWPIQVSPTPAAQCRAGFEPSFLSSQGHFVCRLPQWSHSIVCFA